MWAGKLNEVVKFYKPTITTNEFGEQVQSYELAIETKAEVVHNSGGRTVENGEVFFDYTKTFRVRKYHNIAENYLIEWQGKRYRILSIEEDRYYNNKTIEAELKNE